MTRTAMSAAARGEAGGEGTMVVPGDTSGFRIETDIARIMMKQLKIVVVFRGMLEEFRSLLRLCSDADITPPVRACLPLAEAREGFEMLKSGGLRGKFVLIPRSRRPEARPGRPETRVRWARTVFSDSEHCSIAGIAT